MNLSRKQLAQRTGLSALSIRRNEARLGLDRAKVKVNQRVILYRSKEALQALRSRGLET